MTQVTDSKATATLSGRELALKRRHAMALHGKAGTIKAATVRRPSAQSPGPATAEALATAANGRSVSRARRQALSTAGKAALPSAGSRPGGRVSAPAAATVVTAPAADAPKSCGCGCNGTKQSCDTSVEAVGLVESVSSEGGTVTTRPAGTPSGRALARARRSALSQDGKAGLKRVAQATKLAASLPNQDWEAAISQGATGRQVARQRRLAQSLAGSTGVKKEGARPAGRIRARMEAPAPAKVEEGHTLSGRPVTGTMVERSKKVTGNEPGSCRVITGTEYIGAEQFEKLCATRPATVPTRVGAGASQTARERAVTGTLVSGSGKVTGNEPGATRTVTGTDYATPSGAVAAPSKVAVTHTSQGKTVTGTAVGHSGKTTGDEHGACRGVTGIQYLSMEEFKACSTAAPPAPRKVSVMSSRGEQPVSGTGVGRSEKVTGDEPGACRNITGSQYSMADGALCQVAGPRKVSTMQTVSGRTVTGSEVGPSKKVTGDEIGGCKPVTGTQYVGPDRQAEVCDAPVPVAPVAKVAVDQTWRGQPVTGSYVGRSGKVTGDEQGGCAPISGTPYIGRGQYNSFCEKPAAKEQEARLKESALIPATAVTGDRPGAGGSVMTGDERGACEVVSGTPYIGVDNTLGRCTTSGRFVTRASTWVEPERGAAPIDFSITSPARAAQQKTFGGVTGAGYGSERITGPVNKAGGLITGTPEFRHRDAVETATEQQEVVSAARRLTGEGSQTGRPVTGDAWNAMSRVTGTEGASSQARNPSARGNPRGMGMNAARFREEVEQTPVPPSRITGSAGNAGSGALITLSGGARG